jgi:hypothetical protein
MAPASKTFTFAISDVLKEGLQTVKHRDGISEAEQIRRAIAMWLESKGVMAKKMERKAQKTVRRSLAGLRTKGGA